jgi:leucyl-tRNA---protein transferase
MIKAIHFPTALSGHELDEYLAKGWFRMGQTIFTTDLLPVNGNIHPVYWLRYVLQKVRYGKKQERLLAINKHFSVSLKPFLLSEELEYLYASYLAIIDFDAPPTVESFLLDGDNNSIYDTQLIEIRDAGRLIAAGIFDNGENSIAGIMNFYDPAYKAKSMGKYLMLLKINYAVAFGKLFYYPGYIAGGFSKFDYKLFPDPAAAEIFDSKQEQWISYDPASLSGNIAFDVDGYLPEEG